MDLGELRERYERGRAEATAGRPADAIVVLDAALVDLRDGWPSPAAEPDVARLHVDLLTWLGVARFPIDGLEPALEHVAAAQEIAEVLADDELVAICHSRRSNLYGRSGQLDKALAELDRVVERIDEVEPQVRATTLVNRGTARSFLGELRGAAEDFERAAHVADEHDLPEYAAMALHNLGWMAFLTGDLPRALRLMDSARVRESGIAPLVAAVDEGRVLVEAGLLDEALERFEAARQQAEEQGDMQVAAESGFECARAAALDGRENRARAEVARARDVFASRSAPTWVARCDLLMARLALDAGDAVAAAPNALRAAALADEEGDPALVHDAHLLAAEALVGAGDAVAAEQHVVSARRATAHVPAMVSLSQQLQVLRVRALAARQRGDREGARAIVAAAADVLAASGASGVSLDLRTARAVHGVPLARLDLELALEVGEPAAALAATERWRAITSRLPPVRPVPSPELTDVLARLRQLRRDLLDAPPSAQRQRELADLQQRAREMARRRAPAWGSAHARRDQPSVRPATDPAVLLAASEHSGADLLMFVVHADDLYATGVVDGRTIVRRLGPVALVAEQARRVRADLRAAARHVLGPLHDAVTSSLAKSVAELRATLLGPLGSVADRLAVAPNATTAGLPWQMLAGHGRAVVVAPSATAWAQGVHRPARRVERVDLVRGPGLVHDLDECREVGAAWGHRAVHDERSTTTSTTRSLSEADVVHVAAHGTHHAQNPMFSSLQVLDGPLFLYDLETSGVAAGHVVLSACEVAQSDVRAGHEVLGLAAGILSLGATCVVAAVCTVPDEIGPELMGAYHRELAAGRPSDLALAHALEDADPIAGAYVVTGAPWQAAA